MMLLIPYHLPPCIILCATVFWALRIPVFGCCVALTHSVRYKLMYTVYAELGFIASYCLLLYLSVLCRDSGCRTPFLLSLGIEL